MLLVVYLRCLYLRGIVSVSRVCRVCDVLLLLSALDSRVSVVLVTCSQLLSVSFVLRLIC